MSTSPGAATVTVRGVVEALFFTSPTFSAGRLRVEGADARAPIGVTTVGFAGALMVRVRDAVVLHGSWETHPRFGRQLKVQRFELDQQLSPDGLAGYLAGHPAIKGIGPVKARRIAAAFGEHFDRVIDAEPERVAEAGGLSAAVVENLRTEWLQNRALNASLTWMARFELTHFQMTTLVAKFGNSVVTLLEGDPYLLVREIPGFGFKRVDAIARKVGVPKEEPSRLRAGLMHCVAERLGQGDCWTDYEELIAQAAELLVMDVPDSRARIERELDAAISAGQLACTALAGRFQVAQPNILEMERDLAEVFRTRLHANPHFADAPPPALDAIDARLNEGQRRGIRAACQHNLVVISGGAGVGKTLLVAALTKLYERRSCSVALAAPTGKAAKRIEQVLGRSALTIHRLLGYKGTNFARGIDDPIDADVVIIDEVSMVDVPLAWHLFRAINFDRTCVVLVGDHNQLPPVGPGNLLRDLIERAPIPVVVLDEVVRQAGVLKESSTAILRGEVRRTAPPGPDGAPPWVIANRFTDEDGVRKYVLDLFEAVLADRLGFNLMTDVQLLSPTRKGPLGVDALNVELQRVIQRKLHHVTVPAPRPGRQPALLLHDRVIQRRNNYELGVMNGAIGLVTEIHVKGRDLTVSFDGNEIQYTSAAVGELSLAYALTVHRVQGSEYPCVVFIVHKAHAFMHHRNLFYTGVTRARKTVIVVGDAWGMRNCAQTERVERRKTFLSMLELPRWVPRRT
jgi:exodeoxyribonuclease V alpha subunit